MCRPTQLLFVDRYVFILQQHLAFEGNSCILCDTWLGARMTVCTLDFLLPSLSINLNPLQAIMRQSDPTSTARLRKNEGEEEEARGATPSIEVETEPAVDGKGPPSTNSNGSKSRDEYHDLPTNPEGEGEGEEDGFALTSDKDFERDGDQSIAE
jgi:hypothetical protein